VICIAVPALCYVTDKNSVQWFGGYKFGYEMLIINGLITFACLFLSSLFVSKTSVQYEN
jgi:hypothetical protein